MSYKLLKIALFALMPLWGEAASEQISRGGVNVYIDKNDPSKQRLLSGFFDAQLSQLKKIFNDNPPQTRAVAPAVSSIHILYVCSAHFRQNSGIYDCEAADDKSSISEHGGKPFEVYTAVIGYGGGDADTASFAGNTATQISSVGLDFNGDNHIDGWLDLYDISGGASAGEFIFRANSVNGDDFKEARINITR